MNKIFRRLALEKIARDAGILTSKIKEFFNEEPTNFKSKFLALKAGPEREKLVLDEIIKRKPFSNMVPVTVPGPNGTKITYKVMPDYVTIDGIRVPMSGQTAQKIADTFGFVLPTAKMSDQIWEAANVKFRPQPLSAGGRIGGKYYSGKEVVENKISDSDSAVAYSQMIEDAIGDKEGLKAGHLKDIIEPEGDPNKLGLYGWHGEEGKPLEPSKITGHDTSVHTEYGASARFGLEEVTVQLPNGKTIKTTMTKLKEHPEFYKAIADTKGVKKYKY